MKFLSSVHVLCKILEVNELKYISTSLCSVERFLPLVQETCFYYYQRSWNFYGKNTLVPGC